MSALSDAERAREKELRDAARFIAKNGVGSLPGERSETGESSGRQTVAPGRLRESDGLPRQHRDNLSYDAYEGGPEQFELDHPGARWLVSLGGEPSEGELVTRAKVHHVLSKLSEDQVALLYERHLEGGGSSLSEMGEAHGVSKQAMHKRVARATKAFKDAWDAYSEDDVLWEA